MYTLNSREEMHCCCILFADLLISHLNVYANQPNIWDFEIKILFAEEMIDSIIHVITISDHVCDNIK